MAIATYSFLPFLRQGIANSLKNTGGARAVYTVNLTVEGDGGAVSTAVPPRDVELYGPGDIIGIDSRIILKTDPLNWITNFEPNYLAHIDFYDEDFPWRYTPLEPESTYRLKPWMALLVLKVEEFDEKPNLADRPLPALTLKGITAADVMPKVDQLWAWAHVHVNTDIIGKTIEASASGMEGILDDLQAKINNDPDVAYSRLVCPRKLEPNTTYHAFLVPAFESGRLAGLGDTAANIVAAGAKIAWQDGATPTDFPIYHRWQFATGEVGDFEYLVRLLKPMPADIRVGRRDMDMTKPGANLNWVEAPDFDLDGILRLGGALQVPLFPGSAEEQEQTALDGWGEDRLPHPFQKQIAALLNLADDYSYRPPNEANAKAELEAGLPIDPNDDADPLITPPIYGRWHAMIERVLEDRNGNAIHNNYNWITELNLDPRYRVPAHFGTRVVQENQEDYMNAAWEQIGEVLKANRQIRFAQFAQAAAGVWHDKYLKDMVQVNPAKAMFMTAPAQTHILMDSATVHHTIRQSVVPNVMTSTTMRKITRPKGRFIKDLKKTATESDFRPEALITKLSSGEIRVSPPKEIAPGLLSATEVSESFLPSNAPQFVLKWLRKYPWLPIAVLVLVLIAILLIILFGGGTTALVIGGALIAILLYIYRLLSRWKRSVRAADSVLTENQKPELVDRLPKSADFKLRPFDSTIAPTLGGNTDSEDAVRFKAGLKDVYEVVQASLQTISDPDPFKPIAITPMAEHVVTALDPEVTIPAWTWQHIRIPGWIREQLIKEFFTEAMAYPRFDYPMYKPLAEISADLFLPNINLLEYNSITLLETNQEFIEAYMVGLNHEFGRELLWREYPTDQRGSYFRQFWDVSTLLKADDPMHAGKTEEEIREMYRDIPKLHYWSRNSKLGEHDHRQKPGEPETEEVVLAIRGELLKKYPNAVVYAHKAVWSPKSDTDPAFDKTKSRTLYQEAEGDKETPSFNIIRTPLYKAQVEPDITFFGFKLDADEARGDNDPQSPSLENAGWFFVIKERPGEPRFGFDIPKEDVDADPNYTWNDISWSEVLPGQGVVDVINTSAPIGLKPVLEPSDEVPETQGFTDQRSEDLEIKWNTDSHQVDAADMAYILYQVPVLVAVHASEMLHK